MVEITIRKRRREDAVFTQRKFFKKTARGKVVKGALSSSVRDTRSNVSLVIRERYLRDDVSCGIEKCRECTSTPGSCLPFSGPVDHKQFPDGHFVLPDTNVFLAQVCSPYYEETFSLELEFIRRWISWNRFISKRRLYYCRRYWRKCDTGLFHFTTDSRR